MLKLLSAGPSPFVRKVNVTLHETGQSDVVEQVSVTANPLDPDPTLTAANPVGKIPALVREDAPALYDSPVICPFLDARAQAGLYPDPRIWETLTLEATADGITEAAVLMVYEARFRPEEKRYDGWLDGQWAKIERSVSAVNARWMSHLTGPLTMGQIAMGCALAYLDFRLPDRPWRKGNDALDDWFAVFAERPSMQATRPG